MREALIVIIILTIFLVPWVPVQQRSIYGTRTEYTSVLSLIITNFQRSQRSGTSNAIDDFFKSFEKKSRR
jgi:hypothetical protein